MNKTPDQNTNRYTNYRPDGASERAPGREARPGQAPQRNRPASGAPQRRPMNNEERRRLEAARMAAYQNGGRLTADELRRRQLDQQHLNAAQPGAQTRRSVEPVEPSSSKGKGQARKKKIRFRINVGALLFVLLIAVVIGVSVHQIGKNGDGTPIFDYSHNAGDDEIAPDPGLLPETEEETEPETQADTAAETEDPVEVLLRELYEEVSVANGTMDEGDLVLINHENGYADTDKVPLQNVKEYNKKKYANNWEGMQVSATAIALREEVVIALDTLFNDLYKETGCNHLLVNSAYRTEAEQQSIYDSYVAQGRGEYAATAGYSEHHTGLACDLTFYIWSATNSYSESILDHEFGYWIHENCTDYGFILRYPQDKEEITGTPYEAWHFRYVGVPHAKASDSLGYCLEEYTDHIRTYTAETKLLYIGKDGSLKDVNVMEEEIPTTDGWLTYFVPAAEGDYTDIPLLQGEAYENYELSGNNVDGFVVTVTLP